MGRSTDIMNACIGIWNRNAPLMMRVGGTNLTGSYKRRSEGQSNRKVRKLSDEVKQAIARDYTAGRSTHEISAEYNLTRETIYNTASRMKVKRAKKVKP